MTKSELLKEIVALPLEEQREIFDLLRGQMGEAVVEGGAAGVQKAPEKKRADPWGSVYTELAKTFRRPATR